MNSDTTHTTLVIANIHCPSCVSTIESILSLYPLTTCPNHSARTSLEKVVDTIFKIRSKTSDERAGEIELFAPAFTNIAVSLVSGTVSFSHPSGYPLKTAISELDDAGFEVIQNSTNDEEGRSTAHMHLHTSNIWAWGRFTDLFSGNIKKERAHRDVCVACQQEEENEKRQVKSRKGKQTVKEVNPVNDRAEGGGGEYIESVISIDGMTCSSCTSAVETKLAPESCNGIYFRKVCLMDNTATIVYDPSEISERDIVSIIEELGFDGRVLSSTPTRHHVRPALSNAIAKDPQQFTATLSIEGMTCASCVGAITNALEHVSGVLDHSVDLMGASGTVRVSNRDMVNKVKEEIEDLGYDCEVMDIQRVYDTMEKNRMPEKVTHIIVKMSIEGMTCSSCVGSINNAVQAMEAVSEFQIDLMGHSGTFQVADTIMAAKLKDEIEDLGYVCEIVDIFEGNADGAEQSQAGKPKKRTVNIRIDGFFCEHCPAKANTVLEDLSQRFDIAYTPSTLRDPTSALTYTADPPNFTLRTIRSAIIELGFTLNVVKPESMQDRARQAQKRERDRLSFRLVICVVFCIPTFVLGVLGPSLLPAANAFRQYLETPIWGAAPRYTIALFALATPIQFGVGQFFYVRAFKSLRGVYRSRRGRVSLRKIWLDRLFRWGSMDSLVALGTTIAWASSLAYMVLDITTPGAHGEMGYFDTSVFLLTFIIAGRYMESVSRQRTGDALLELGKLRPQKGLLHFDEKPAEEVEAAFIEIGDYLLLPVGTSSPVDCLLAAKSPSTSFDEASLTGESRPVPKVTGDIVYAGTINSGPSAAILIVQHGDGDTVIDSITNGVREAMSRKASIERIADAITAVFVPVIVGIACFTFAIWILRGYTGSLPNDWLNGQRQGGWVLFSFQFSVAVLVVACPCGIGLAAPTAQLIGVGLAARHGIMPNGGGEAFQAFSHINAIAFDKTGTITLGKFQVSDHLQFHLQLSSLPNEMLWHIVSCIEQASTHPIALAIHAFAKKKVQSDQTQVISNVLDIQEIPGRGMIGTLQLSETKVETLIGNESMMTESGVIITEEIRLLLRKWQGEGKSVVLVSLKTFGGRPVSQTHHGGQETTRHSIVAVFAVADPLRPEASFVLEQLKSRGVDIYIVSGDGVATVRAVAKQLNLREDQVVGNQLPEDKKRFVERLQETTVVRRNWWSWRKSAQRKLVAFCGDGVNDAIALAQADVSIAQGGGSQAATSTADFALISESLLSILTLQAIAKATYRRILINFLWASVFNVVLIPISAGAFYDLGQTKLPAVWASLAMALSSVSVVVNSLFLRWTFRIPREVRKYRDQA